MQTAPTVPGSSTGAQAMDARQAPLSPVAQAAMPSLRSETPRQALLDAVRGGDPTTVKRLLAAGGLNPNEIDGQIQLTPLMLASRQGEDDVVFVLTKTMQPGDLNLKNGRGESALSIAAARGNDSVVALLLDRQAHVEQCTHNGRTPLAEAVAGGHLRTAELLIARGAAIDGGREVVKPPLAIAARRGNVAMVDLLLAKKANPQLADRDGWTACHHAASQGHDALAEKLNGQASAPVWQATPVVPVVTAGTATMFAATITTTTTTTATAAIADPLEVGKPAAGALAIDHPDVQMLAGMIKRDKLALSGKMGDDLDEDTIRALAGVLSHPDHKLAELTVGVGCMNVDMVAMLAEALKDNLRLTKLDLCYNQIDEKGAALLSKALEGNRALTKLGLSDNQIGDGGAASLAAVLKVNSTLTEITIQFNQISIAGANYLAEALRINRALHILDLTGNWLEAAGAISLAEALMVNDSLTRLDISFAKIDAASVAALADMLKRNRGLISLGMRGNKIGDDGTSKLAEALKVNSSLTDLSLYDAKIGPAGAEALAAALQVNNTLASLALEENQIGGAGAALLADALNSNTTLTSLNIESNKIPLRDQASVAAINERLERNKQLKKKS